MNPFASRTRPRHVAFLLLLLGAAPAWSQTIENAVFVAMPPCRIVDTRGTNPPAAIAGGSTRTFSVVGISDYSAQGGPANGCLIPGFSASGVPAVTAVAIHVVAVNPAAKGNLLVYPTNVAPGTSSTLNFPPPSVPLNVANGVIVPVRSDAQGNDIAVKPTQTTHVVIDVTGYFTPMPIRAGLNTTSPDLVAGSPGNTIDASSVGSTIAGGGSPAQGQRNRVAQGSFATISGGLGNTTASDFATVHGGLVNTAYSPASTIGGGEHNVIGVSVNDLGGYQTIAGGKNNVAKGAYSTVCGGEANQATANFATACGGANNVASGIGSFAAGLRAKATDDGSFVWADFSAADFDSAAINSFNVRATGGVLFESGRNPQTQVQSGVRLVAGSGAWSSLSDREAKRDVRPVAAHVLESLATMPIRTWRYADEDPKIRHIGPTAPDFRQAFGLGRDERHIDMIDVDGVALAAIQELLALARDDRGQLEKNQKKLDRVGRTITGVSRRLDDAAARIEKGEERK